MNQKGNQNSLLLIRGLKFLEENRIYILVFQEEITKVPKIFVQLKYRFMQIKKKLNLALNLIWRE
jgi:hypothetical protein